MNKKNCLNIEEYLNTCSRKNCCEKCIHKINNTRLCKKHFEQEQKFPILGYIRNWLDASIFGWRRSHLIIHPWILINEWFYQIKWAWQRVFRGWDDRVIWSLDMYLARKIPVWLWKISQSKVGMPHEMFESDDFQEDADYMLTDGAMERAEERYNNIIQQIIAGFHAYVTIQDEMLIPQNEEYKILNEIWEEGFKLFKKYFGTFNT